MPRSKTSKTETAEASSGMPADPSSDKTELSAKNYIAALARGLAVMRAFGKHGDRHTLTEISKIVDLPRATARRCLITLNRLGYVETTGKYFRLTPQVLTLAQAYFLSNPLPHIALPIIEKVSEAVRESCSLSVLTGDEVVYIARSSRKRQASVLRDIGVNLPAYCTSMGRVLLANLPPSDLNAYFARVKLTKFNHKTIVDEATLRKLLEQVRHDDFCLIDGELEHDLRAISIPVRTSTGSIVAALNVSTESSRITSKQLVSQVLPKLRQAASNIRNAMVN